jgi:hypothetical protein
LKAAVVVLLVLGGAAILAGCNSLGGELTSSKTALGSWTFEPTRCSANPGGLTLSSRYDPLVYVSLSPPTDSGGAAPTILGPQSLPLQLMVLDLAAGNGAPLVVPASRCSVLSMHMSPSFSTRVNTGPWITSYSGEADIDCAGPDGEGRFTGHFSFTCPER